MALEDFPPVSTLAPNSSTNVLLGIDFNDTTQPAQFEIIHDNKKFTVSITAPVGELLQPNTLTENDFTTLQGRLHRKRLQHYKVDYTENYFTTLIGSGEFEWGFYALSASKAIFRARTYNCVIYSVR